VEHGDVDPFFIHHLDSRVRIVTAGQDIVPGEFARALEVRESARRHRGRDRQRGTATILAVNEKFVAPVAIAPNLYHPIAKLRLGVVFPQRARLDDMPVGVDYPGHERILLEAGSSGSINTSMTRRAQLSSVAPTRLRSGRIQGRVRGQSSRSTAY